MASNPPLRRAAPPHPFLGLPNNTLTAPTSSDPNRTIGSAGMVVFHGDPQQQSILFAGIFFLRLHFVMEDVVKYICTAKTSQLLRSETGRLMHFESMLITKMFGSQALHTYIWDIAIYIEATRGDRPSFADTGRFIETPEVFSPFFSYAIVRHMLRPLEYAVDVERIWHDERYSHILQYVRCLWMALSHGVYSCDRMKKRVTSGTNPDVNMVGLHALMKHMSAEYWKLKGWSRVEDLPCPE